jgi:hypothetical protein
MSTMLRSHSTLPNACNGLREGLGAERDRRGQK